MDRCNLRKMFKREKNQTKRSEKKFKKQLEVEAVRSLFGNSDKLFRSISPQTFVAPTMEEISQPAVALVPEREILDQRQRYLSKKSCSYRKQAIINNLRMTKFDCRFCRQLKLSMKNFNKNKLDRFKGVSSVCEECGENFFINSFWEQHMHASRFDLNAQKKAFRPMQRFQKIILKYSCIRGVY